jgi:hypothetical protein
VHGEGRLQADVEDVVNVVLGKGPALAAGQRPADVAVTVLGLLSEGAADGQKGAGGLPVVVPAGSGAGRPGQEPDLEVGAGVELDPAAFSALMVDQGGELGSEANRCAVRRSWARLGHR